MQYKRTQNGYLIIGGLLGIAIFLAITGIVAGRDGLLIRAIIEVILLVCAIVFSKLTIKIDGESLEASFATGLIRKKVPLAEIADCEPVRIRWWYGWGIHLTPNGWLYNVSGLDAVAIKLRSGRKFALGTDDADGLTAAIRRSVDEQR
jgi:hypothetical protein